MKRHGFTYHWLLAGAMGLTVGIALAGCKDLGDGVGLRKVEERLRPGEERRGKVGSLRGWEVVHHAHRVADEIRRRPDPDCLFTQGESFVIEAELELERRRGEEVRQRWTERRTYRRDIEGREEAHFEATFLTELAENGTRSGRWIRTSDGLFVEEGPGRFSLRPDAREKGGELLGRGPGFLDTLLGPFKGGWRRVHTPHGSPRWEAVMTDGDALRCSEEAVEVDRAWIDRFAPRAQLLSGTLSFEAADAVDKKDAEHEEQPVPSGPSRTLMASWKVGDGETLNLRYEERLMAPATEAIEVPEAMIVLGSGDGSLAAIEASLMAWIKKGWLEETRWPPQEDEE